MESVLSRHIPTSTKTHARQNSRDSAHASARLYAKEAPLLPYERDQLTKLPVQLKRKW
jgi:hypothetical protein